MTSSRSKQLTVITQTPITRSRSQLVGGPINEFSAADWLGHPMDGTRNEDGIGRISSALSDHEIMVRSRACCELPECLVWQYPRMTVVVVVFGCSN